MECIIKKSEQVVTERIIHKFHCDNCGKDLGSVEEYPDGYYEHPGDYKFDAYIDECVGGWVSIKGELCPDCYKKICDRLKEAIKEVGVEFALSGEEREEDDDERKDKSS